MPKISPKGIKLIITSSPFTPLFSPALSQSLVIALYHHVYFLSPHSHAHRHPFSRHKECLSHPVASSITSFLPCFLSSPSMSLSTFICILSLVSPPPLKVSSSLHCVTLRDTFSVSSTHQQLLKFLFGKTTEKDRMRTCLPVWLSFYFNNIRLFAIALAHIRCACFQGAQCETHRGLTHPTEKLHHTKEKHWKSSRVLM